MFDWNCQIFQRTNRQIIKVTQTPLKSLYLLGRNKKKSVHLQSDILPGKPTKQRENFQFLLSMLFPYKKQATVWGPLPWDSDQHPGLQASPVSLLQSPWILHSPASLTGQPGCSSCMSGLSLGNSGLFNYLARDGADFSLFSWQPRRIHPSFSFSQRRFKQPQQRTTQKMPTEHLDERGSRQFLPGTAQPRGWALEQKICENWH